MLKHKEKFDRSKVRVITSLAFFIGFSQAASIYVLSTFFEGVVGTSNVGYFYAGANAVFLLILLNLHWIVKKIGKSEIFSLACLFEILILCLLIYLKVTHLSAYLAAMYIVFSMIVWVVLDIILEGFSEDKSSGQIRGLHLTLYNSGILFGPFVSFWIISTDNKEKLSSIIGSTATSLANGFDGIFMLVIAVCVLILAIFIYTFRRVQHEHKKRLHIKVALINFWKKKNLVRIYYVSFVLEAFYALMIIYMPIYLRENAGLSLEEIGIVFTIMLIPFVLIQYPAGILADKKYGEKEFLIFSLILMAISTGAIYFISSQAVLIWAIVLFINRIGVALVEVLRDSYFYKQIDGEDVDSIDFFRTAMPVGYILAAMLSSILLFFFSIEVVFLIIVTVILTGLYPAFRLKDTR